MCVCHTVIKVYLLTYLLTFCLHKNVAVFFVLLYFQPAAQSSDSYNELPANEAAKRKHKRELVTADFTEEQEQEMVDWLPAAEQ